MDDAIEVRVETHKRLVERLEGTLKRGNLSRQQFEELTMMLTGLDLIKERYIEPHIKEEV